MTRPAVAGAYEFSVYSTSIKTPWEAVVHEVLRLEADVYAFSCYVWNMGLVNEVRRAVRAARPGVHIILGGPQVMRQAARYLEPGDERTVVCNGEGEQAFADYLTALAQGQPSLADIAGLSFRRNAELVTTADRPRLADLNLIPSPYLSGIIEPEYSVAIMETNRGCPYHCGFCFWGAATNDRVYRFDEDRIRAELTWLSDNDVMFLYIADANWGMLSRDIDFTKHLAAEARRTGLPSVVYFSAAKNKPHAVTAITEVLQDAGLIATQPVSLQTLEPASLRTIARSNIKLAAFTELQDDLAARGISSFIELIWPLPGETLTSFKAGINDLCIRHAQTIIAYSHLLLHNTPIYQRRAELGLATRRAAADVAEAEIVVATADVSVDEFVEGMWFFYALHALHNTRSLAGTLRYLAERDGDAYARTFSDFADFWRKECADDDPIVDFTRRSIDEARYYDIGNYGELIHHVLHEHRALFDRTLQQFSCRQEWWTDETARTLFELDLLNRPYIYSNTPRDFFGYPFTTVDALTTARGYVVRLRQPPGPELLRHLRIADDADLGSEILVDHRRRQFAHMADQPMEHNANYCHGMIEKVENILPTWRRPAA
ncbi:cobalamin-dependent protein [Micromonospora violae]|nr:cobalamin-dependent protein [Micromonospora violae]